MIRAKWEGWAADHVRATVAHVASTRTLRLKHVATNALDNNQRWFYHCCMHKRTVAADLIVNLPDTDECLEWPLYRRGMGYGQVYYEGKLWRAHVLSWTLHRGVIPEGLIVCHECDNPPCYNPLHLS